LPAAYATLIIQPMSKVQHFRITYDGEALREHRMDVRELAPALLAMGDLCEAAGIAIYGRNTRASVSVKASFKTGSFGIDLELAHGFANQVLDFLSGREASAFANAAAIVSAIGFSGKGLIGFLKKLKGRPISRIEPTQDRAIVTLDDGEQIEIERAVLELLRDMSVRENLEKVIAPIERDGIDTVAFGTDDSIGNTVLREEALWFAVPAPQEVLLFDNVRQQAFSIVSLAFKEDNKWRLYDGAATIHAAIVDAEFLSRVDQSLEFFAKGDILICEVRVMQWQTADGARTEYTVTRVLEHRQAARQVPLPFAPEKPE